MLEMDSLDCIETELKDILTLNSCTTLLSELIKFILYRKQQLPYTFDRLKYLITKRNSKEKLDVTSASVERHFKVAQDGLDTLELIFEKTREELSNYVVHEVALLFGSTPMNPKQVYRIHLPQVSLSHSSVNHPERKQLFHILHSVIVSNNLCNMLKSPLSPTNMFVFIRKHSRNNRGNNSISEWFTPKNRYEIPKNCQQFHIKFRRSRGHPTDCGCQNFEIFTDDVEVAGEKQVEDEKEEEEAREVGNVVWYQACGIFKGFTDVYINGISVADLWLR